jgi:uncharacterized protein YcgL (UPF0745 family)
MTREEYVALCQQRARAKAMRKDLSLYLVEYEGFAYLPYKYTLGFDKDGKPMHTAVLLSADEKKIYNVDLEGVKRVEKED